MSSQCHPCRFRKVSCFRSKLFTVFLIQQIHGIKADILIHRFSGFNLAPIKFTGLSNRDVCPRLLLYMTFFVHDFFLPFLLCKVQGFLLILLVFLALIISKNRPRFNHFNDSWVIQYPLVNHLWLIRLLYCIGNVIHCQPQFFRFSQQFYPPGFYPHPRQTLHLL